MKKLFIPVVVIIAITLIVIAYKSKKILPTEGKVRVVASFYPLAEFAGQVGGDKIEVVNITPTGIEPHDFEPTSKDITNVYSAKAFIFNGGGIDPWADKIKSELEKKGIVAVNIMEQLKLLPAGNKNTVETAPDHERSDPHIWLDPLLAMKEVEIIRDTLKVIDPANSQVYTNNAEHYLKKLSVLDRKYRDGLSTCANRNAISSHAAFGYLAKRYRINVFPIVFSPEEEPSPQKIANLAQLARVEGIKYIFFETLASPKLAETIAREAGATTLVFNPLEGLTEKEIAEGKNYISIMEENLNNLRVALKCK